MKPRERPRWLTVSVLGLCLAHAVLTALLARARCATVHHHTYDLTLYARLTWGLVHGEAWDPIVSGGGLGGHLALVLLPLGALGALIGTVPVLVIRIYLGGTSIDARLLPWPLPPAARYEVLKWERHVGVRRVSETGEFAGYTRHRDVDAAVRQIAFETKWRAQG